MLNRGGTKEVAIRARAMQHRRAKLAGALIVVLWQFLSSTAEAQNVVVVVIDGARYSETFGDANRTYIPKMGQLALQGAYVDPFYNDNFTYTSRAIPALWCGTWTEVENLEYAGNQTQATLQPTIFEYFRKQKAVPATQCYYVIKSLSSLWLPSFHQDYGPSYWPAFHSYGATDDDVLVETLRVMQNEHPQFLWVYLADVDSRGHSGNWDAYTAAIVKADSIVSVIWEALQNDPYYAGSTTLLVTNDHGRHDDLNGGFRSHGDGCAGCRQIMLLAVGPGIKQNYVTTQYHAIPDFAVTAAHLLDVDPEYATGSVIFDILTPLQISDPDRQIAPDGIELSQNYPNPFNPVTTVTFTLPRTSNVTVTLYDLLGHEIVTLFEGEQSEGYHKVQWYGRDNKGQPAPAGIYIARLVTPNHTKSIKMLLLK